MSKAAFRFLDLLKRVPRAPGSVTVEELRGWLDTKGYRVDIRSVQRDLVAMAQAMPLDASSTRPAKWSWRRDAPAMHLGGMDPATAVVMSLAHSVLGPILPKPVRARVKPRFDEAERTDDSNFVDRVRLIGDGVPRRPPNIDEEVLDLVSEGLYVQRKLMVEYEERDHSMSTLLISPVAMAGRGNRLSLVASEDGETTRRLLLHMIKSAQVQAEPAVTPPGFDIDAYIASGQMHYRFNDEPILLELEFDDELRDYLTDQKLSEAQLVHPVEDGRYALVAQVADTSTLRAWILGMGGRVKVLRPKAIAKWVAENGAAAAALYAED